MAKDRGKLTESVFVALRINGCMQFDLNRVRCSIGFYPSAVVANRGLIGPATQFA